MSSNFSRFTELGRKIICVGRNYGEHAAELGHVLPKEPLLFMKPPSSYITEGKPIKIPRGCDNFHHEIELGVVIGEGGADIKESDAMNHVAGYALALDMTDRGYQNIAMEQGLPWELAKGFDTSCPVSAFIPKDLIPNPHNLDIWCKVNGEWRQNANTKDMIFTIPYLISYISQHFSLEPYDVILTGTPAGVGAVKQGDSIEGGLSNIVKFVFMVQNKQ